jgi:hypothetical protein
MLQEAGPGLSPLLGVTATAECGDNVGLSAVF